MKKLLNLVIMVVGLLTAGSLYSADAPTLKDIAELESKKQDIEKVVVEKKTGFYDEFNRSTPRSSIVGLARAVREEDYERAVNYLDLRNLPFSLNEDQDGADLVRKLVIVAERAMTIDLEDLSDEVSGHQDDGLPSYRDRITTVKTKKGPVDILLQRVPGKDGALIWKISNRTVAKIPELNDEFGYGFIGDKMSLIFPHRVMFGFEVWQLVMMAGLLVVGYLGSVVVTFIIVRLMVFNQRFNTERPKKFIVGPLRFLMTILFFRATFDLIAPSLVARAMFEAKTFLIIAVLWVMMGVVDLILARMADRMERNGQHDAVVLLKPAGTGIKIIIIMLAVISWVDNLGYQVTTILAGLGVGGIAVALAAQKSLENLIGAITIYSSRPVRVGDFCKFDEVIGTVEEIGLRATKLRTLARTVVNIPNAAFASGVIENLTERDKILYRTRLRLALDETPEHVKLVLTKLRELIKDREYIDEGNSRVRFLEFGEYAQELELYVYIKTTVFSEYLGYLEEVNLSISDIVESVGVKLVVPSNMTYLNQPIETRPA